MPKLETVQKSRKSPGSCRKCGTEIAKGDAYRHITIAFAEKRIFCMKPACDPTEIDYATGHMAELIEARDSAVKQLEDRPADIDDLRSIVEEAATNAREIADQYNEAAESMGGSGPNAERADAVGEWADSIEGFDPEEFAEEDHEAECYQEAFGEIEGDYADLSDFFDACRKSEEDTDIDVGQIDLEATDPKWKALDKRIALFKMALDALTAEKVDERRENHLDEQIENAKEAIQDNFPSF